MFTNGDTYTLMLNSILAKHVDRGLRLKVKGSLF